MLLVGSYDGSGNFGDVLQMASAIETVAGAARSPLPIAVVERETYAHHTHLLNEYPRLLSRAAFVHYHEGGEADEDGLIELETASAPGRAALLLYGGGYVNGWWGARKVAHATAGERLIGDVRLPVVASGLQVEESTVAPGGAAHELLSRVRWLGARDVISLKHVQTHLDVPAELTGDDAVPYLRFPPVAVEPIVNLHVNAGEWVSDDAGAMAERMARLLRGLGEGSQTPLQLQPVIAYEDPRVSERAVVERLLKEYREAFRESGLNPIPALDLLADASHGELARFRRASLTVACSYHVTLASLLAGTPAVLLADNAYYDQKAAGLRDLFGLDERLVGVDGTAADIGDVLAAASDGARHCSLVNGLRCHSEQVAERFAHGREAVRAALAASLRRRSRRDLLRRWSGRAAGA